MSHPHVYKNLLFLGYPSRKLPQSMRWSPPCHAACSHQLSRAVVLHTSEKTEREAEYLVRRSNYCQVWKILLSEHVLKFYLIQIPLKHWLMFLELFYKLKIQLGKLFLKFKYLSYGKNIMTCYFYTWGRSFGIWLL